MAESVTKHEAIRSYPLDLVSCTRIINARIYESMDDAFRLNCRPTVPVGCEEQIGNAKCSFLCEGAGTQTTKCMLWCAMSELPHQQIFDRGDHFHLL